MRPTARRWVSDAARPGAAAQSPDENLLAPTPQTWFDTAPGRLHKLLLDHANCEKKAASTALALIFAYADDFELTRQLSRLAREELLHFEQVQKLLVSLALPYRRLTPSRYAEGLRAAVATTEPARRSCGALIEARSCERFAGLAPRLPEPVASFYRGLEESESRHFMLYLELASRHAERHGLDAGDSLLRLAETEARLATAPDPQFRFHSGEPVGRER